MRYPNLRYGRLEHLEYYSMGWKIKDLAKHLRRDEKTVKNWLSGKHKIPWWVPELLRLEAYEKHQQLRYMGINQHLAKIGMVYGEVVEFPDQFAVRARLEKLDAPHPIEVSNKRIINELKVAAG